MGAYIHPQKVLIILKFDTNKKRKVKLVLFNNNIFADL